MLARRRVAIDVPELFKDWIEGLEEYQRSGVGPPASTVGVLEMFKHMKATFPQDVALMQSQLEWYVDGQAKALYCAQLTEAGLTIEEAKELRTRHPVLSHAMFNTPSFK